MDLTFLEIIVIIITIFFGIIAVKITFSFDINKHQETKQKKLENKIKNYCIHARFIEIGDKCGFSSTFVSPPGTTSWICQTCGLTLMNYNRDEEEERFKYYFKNPKEYKKDVKKFDKLLKKAGYL